MWHNFCYGISATLWWHFHEMSLRNGHPINSLNIYFSLYSGRHILFCQPSCTHTLPLPPAAIYSAQLEAPSVQGSKSIISQQREIAARRCQVESGMQWTWQRQRGYHWPRKSRWVMEPAAVKAKHAPALLPVSAKMQFVGEIKLNGISPSRQLDMLESGKLKKDSIHQMPSRRKAFGQVQVSVFIFYSC